MRPTYLLVCSALLLSCAPGDSFKPFQPTKRENKSGSAQPLGSDAIPVPSEPGEILMPPPDDPEEEEKAIEPAIIGGAYLYCDANEKKDDKAPPEPMNVGCRIGNVPDDEWLSADKNMMVMNNLDSTIAPSVVTALPKGSPYHMIFDSDRSLQNNVELHVEVMLPQGFLQMSTTVNPGSLKAIEQRIGKGLALFASTGSAGDWPGMDRKTWNLWMPLKIPRYISNYAPGGSNAGQGPGADQPKDKIELIFDETVCTYSVREGKPEGIKGAKPEDFIFESCSRNWNPDEWVRVKTLTLQIKAAEGAGRATRTAGVVLQTAP
ncbi:hypothetical protein [Oligoflexus tunisiensis]|uniref:hypothetical protein n=1 Tax=Oligoflexus tunisiensis TaxID=708132 RepID=UPI00114D1914|nr:hypothetical protein [Oligoflexus tunisiensis]